MARQKREGMEKEGTSTDMNCEDIITGRRPGLGQADDAKKGQEKE
jgi:hypothetical protein